MFENDVLLCEFSQYHVCLGRADANSKKIKGLSYYELRNLLEPEKLHDILKAEEATPQNKIIWSSAFRNVVLMPTQQFTEEGARQIFSATYGTHENALFFNEVPSYNLMLVHALPQGLMEVLKSSGSGGIMHVYSCVLQANTSGNQLSVQFTGKEVQVLAIKEGQLQLAQTYLYTAPLDVVYYLLSICQQYDFLQADVELVVSGLISEDSAMYKELYQYFSNIHFWKPASKAHLQSEHPPHFFSSMYNLASCAL